MTCKNLSNVQKSESSLEETQQKNSIARCSDTYSEILQTNSAPSKSNHTYLDLYGRPSQPDIVKLHPPTPHYKDNHDCGYRFRGVQTDHNLLNHLQYDNYFNPFTQNTVPMCTSSVKSISDYCSPSMLYENQDNTYWNEKSRFNQTDNKGDLNESSPGTHV